MSHRVLLAADLDRTLVYSRAALGPGAGAPVVAVEHRDGRPVSFMTRRAAAALAALAAEHLLVPVTTRTREQLARVTLPGPPPRYRVAANGGILLVDGAVDRSWDAEVRASVGRVAPLPEARATLAAAGAGQPRTADGLFCYAVVDRGALALDAVERLREWAGPAGWSVSLQGRKLYLVPAPLTKAAAVAEVARRAGAGTVLAAGDSLLDVDLLAAADRGVHPGHGELADSGWTSPRVEGLAATGGRAGEEIVAWLATAAARAAGEPAARTGMASARIRRRTDPWTMKGPTRDRPRAGGCP